LETARKQLSKSVSEDSQANKDWQLRLRVSKTLKRRQEDAAIEYQRLLSSSVITQLPENADLGVGKEMSLNDSGEKEEKVQKNLVSFIKTSTTQKNQPHKIDLHQSETANLTITQDAEKPFAYSAGIKIAPIVKETKYRALFDTTAKQVEQRSQAQMRLIDA
jgi:hypothetical protein